MRTCASYLFRQSRFERLLVAAEEHGTGTRGFCAGWCGHTNLDNSNSDPNSDTNAVPDSYVCAETHGDCHSSSLCDIRADCHRGACADCHTDAVHNADVRADGHDCGSAYPHGNIAPCSNRNHDAGCCRADCHTNAGCVSPDCDTDAGRCCADCHRDRAQRRGADCNPHAASPRFQDRHSSALCDIRADCHCGACADCHTDAVHNTDVRADGHGCTGSAYPHGNSAPCGDCNGNAGCSRADGNTDATCVSPDGDFDAAGRRCADRNSHTASTGFQDCHSNSVRDIRADCHCSACADCDTDAVHNADVCADGHDCTGSAYPHGNSACGADSYRYTAGCCCPDCDSNTAGCRCADCNCHTAGTGFANRHSSALCDIRADCHCSACADCHTDAVHNANLCADGHGCGRAHRYGNSASCSNRNHDAGCCRADSHADAGCVSPDCDGDAGRCRADCHRDCAG